MRAGVALAAILAGCRDDDPARLTDAELRDPAACAECHPDHVREWSGSMHAYAAEDPVFRAMNARMLRSDPEDPTLCVRCHAPRAWADGKVADGDVTTLAEGEGGVTCAFCHLVEDVGGTHNNPLVLADDRVLRGPIDDPVANPAHRSRGSALHDREDPRSSELCGACHDIVTPAGAAIENTYAEWRGSLFAKPAIGLQCGECHLPRREGSAAADAGTRKVHDHSMPGVDLALGDFPERPAQRALVQEFLDDSVLATLCVAPPAGGVTLVSVTLENLAAGHRFPSGATADRRVWPVLRAWEGDALLWEAGADPEATGDPDLWALWDGLVDADGAPTHDLWAAHALVPGDGLPVQATLDPTDPAYVNPHRTRTWLVRGGTPDRITLEVHVVPIGREILRGLVEGGDLDPAVVDAMPELVLGTTVQTWTPAAPVNHGDLACVPAPPPPTLGSAP